MDTLKWPLLNRAVVELALYYGKDCTGIDLALHDAHGRVLVRLKAYSRWRSELRLVDDSR